MKPVFNRRLSSALYLFVLPALTLGAVAACTVDEVTPSSDSGAAPGDDAGTGPETANNSETGTDGGVDASRPPATCLADATLDELVVLDSAFPFCVTRRYEIDAAPVAQVNWSTTAGGIATLAANGTKVRHYAIPGAAATGKLTPVDTALATIPSMPPPCPATGPKPDPCGGYFNGTPTEAKALKGALWSYTASGAGFPGEALFMGATFTVQSRAFSNGIYSTAVVDGATPRVVISALSPLAAARPVGAAKNGLYVSEFCNNQLLPAGACKSFQLLEVGTVSGPIASDLSTSNLAVFIPDYSGDEAKVEAFAFTKKDVMDATGKLTRTPIATFAVGGSQTVAMLPEEKGAPGWLLNKNYDDFDTGAKVGVEGASYTLSGGTIVAGKAPSKVISHGKNADDLNLVTDDEGDLWVVVSTPDAKAVLLELRRKP